jgi:uncharacterized protein
MRVVFDTNIFISAFVIPGGRAEEAYLHVLKGDAALYTSVAILTETAQKLKTKFGWKEDRVIRLLKAIAKVATVLKTRVYLHVLSDEPDNRILECALKADAYVIVTGDKHLLTLQKYQNTSIVRLNDFLKMF